MIFVPMLHYLQNKNSFSGNEDDALPHHPRQALRPRPGRR